jgi:hypothetical protein
MEEMSNHDWLMKTLRVNKQKVKKEIIEEINE